MQVNVADLEDSAHYEASQSLKGIKGGYANNFSQNQADEAREVFLHYYKIAQALSTAQKMGITEIVLRTPAGEVAVPVTSTKWMGQIHNDLQEMLTDKMGDMEEEILDYEEEAINEERDRKGVSDRARLLAHCMPMRPLNDAEFAALPAEAQRAYLQYGDLARDSATGRAPKAAPAQ